MKVAHRDDYDTHAVIGGKEIEAFGIAQTAEFFTVLSDTLYSDKPRAVAREVLCNAWDAHIATGRTDIPVKVTTTGDKLMIQDFGTGIPHTMIHAIYCVYGNSTKENDGRQTGGFGLGSKSPFAYSDHFTVDNRFEGLRVVHAISRGSALTQGKPDRRVMVSVPTTESGVTVTIPLKNEHDAKLFKQHIRDIASFGEMNVELDGKLVSTVPISKAEDNLYITNQTDIPNVSSNDTILVRYGSVIYPVREHEDIAGFFKRVNNALFKIPRKGYNSWSRDDRAFKLIINAPPSSISVTPSRESLAMTETTANTLNGIFEKILPRLDVEHPAFKAEVQKRRDEAFSEFYRKGKPHQIFTAQNLVDEKSIVDYDGSGNTVINNTYDFSLYVAAKQSAFKQDEGATEQHRRVKLLQEAGWPHRDDLIWYDRCFTDKRLSAYTFPRAFTERFTRRLVRGIAKTEHMKPKFLTVRFPSGGGELRSGFVEAVKADLTMWQIFAMMQRIIIVTHSKLALNDDWRRFTDKWGLPADVPRYVYACPRSPKHREEAVAFFQRMGFYVLDHGAWVEANDEKYERAPKSAFQPVKTVRKVEGLPALSSCKQGKNGFNKRGHLQESPAENPLFTRILDFEAIMQAESLSGRDFQHKFFPWGDNVARTTADLFGSRIAVALNYKQVDKWLGKGKIRGQELIVNEVCDYVLNSPALRHEFEVKATRMDAEIRSISGRLQEMAEHSPLIASKLPILPKLNELDQKYLTIFESLRNHADSRYFRPMAPWELKLKGTVERVKEIGPSKILSDYHLRLHQSSKLQLLDLTTMAIKLEQLNRYRDQNEAASLRTYIEICVLTALQ